MESKVWNIRGIVFTALFAALFIVTSLFQISLGFNPVPFTLETLTIMLAGGLLGPRYGFASIFLVIALTALGLPLIHGEGGWTLMAGRTGGFLWSFPIAALLIGYFAKRITGSRPIDYVLMFLVMEGFGSILVYIGGAPWFMHVMDFSLAKSLSLAVYPFIITDLIKAVAATAIVISVRKFAPVLSIPKYEQKSL